MILIMTATVVPAQIHELCLRDAETRLQQYCSALQFYIRCKKFDKIVFCDNSNYEYEYIKEKNLAKKRGVLLEILKFTSDYRLVEKYGKGYGEGEILKYVVLHSDLLKDEEYFYKVTGRLIVKNISHLVKAKEREACFLLNLYAYHSLDTRFWGMEKKVFAQYLMESYKKVNDEQGKYLEMCYKEKLERNGVSYRPFRLYPCIKGYSGTVGKVYHETTWYTKILNDMLCYFNKYNSTEGFLVAFLAYNVVICKKKIKDAYEEYLLNCIE